MSVATTSVPFTYFYISDKPFGMECVDCGREDSMVSYAGPAAPHGNINSFSLECWKRREEFFLKNGRPLRLSHCDYCWKRRVAYKYEDAAVGGKKVRLCSQCRAHIEVYFNKYKTPAIMPIQPYENERFRVTAPFGPGIICIEQKIPNRRDLDDED